MKSVASIALVACLGASIASAETPTAFSQLRHDFPQIDEAIAAATESDLNGTFNRLSALYHRPPVDSALPGSAATLPENFARNLEATLIDLQEDLGKDQVGDLTVRQKLDLLQLVDVYAMKRPIELWGTALYFKTCNPCPIGASPEDPCGNCLDNDPAAVNEVQDTAIASRTLYRAVWESIAPADRPSPSPSGLTATNFGGAVDNLLYIKGVESIDD